MTMPVSGHTISREDWDRAAASVARMQSVEACRVALDILRLRHDAEVERLQARIDAHLAEANRQLDAKDAEVERLRDDNRRIQEWRRMDRQRLDQALVEAERLREDFEQLQASVADFRAAIEAQRERRTGESDHDHQLASAVLDDVVAEYDLRFEDDAR